MEDMTTRMTVQDTPAHLLEEFDELLKAMAPTNASLQSIAAESKALKSEVVRLTSSLEHLHHQQLRQSNELTEQIKQAVSIEKETSQVLDRHNRDVSCFDKNIKLKYALDAALSEKRAVERELQALRAENHKMRQRANEDGKSIHELRARMRKLEADQSKFNHTPHPQQKINPHSKLTVRSGDPGNKRQKPNEQANISLGRR